MFLLHKLRPDIFYFGALESSWFLSCKGYLIRRRCLPSLGSVDISELNPFFLFVDCFFPPLQPASSCRCPMLSVSHLFMFSWLRGRPKTRERNHWSASQCLCLCLGFHRSLFPHSHNCFSFFSKPLPTPPTLRYKCSLDVLLSDCPPANSERPTCVCAPVWLLAPSVWTARRRKTHQVGEALRLGRKERLWCSAGFADFPPQSAETQTSEQALSGKRFCQMDINPHRIWRGGGRPACTFEPFTPWAKLW